MWRRSRSLPVLATSLLLGATVLQAPAPASAQTIDEIIKRGKVIIGVNTTTPIFGLAGKERPEGTTRTWRGCSVSTSECPSSSSR